MKRYLLPLLVFLVLVGFFAVGLNLNPREVPSPLIGKPVPAFSLPRLDDASKKFAAQDMKGKVWIVNVWASWCAPCRQEHPLVNEMVTLGGAPVVGLNYKDKPDNARAWLTELGNPFVAIASDLEGLVGIEFGVYGVPETFVIDQAGVIRLKHIGPLTPEALQGKILPMLRKLGA
ncbi:MAG: DsbE family thiol:disulfide interchange protein [Pseudorhodobacter sp.]|nr:DsbE family thiol:disulfide interchange protein [Rhizobacter sp.]